MTNFVRQKRVRGKKKNWEEVMESGVEEVMATSGLTDGGQLRAAKNRVSEILQICDLLQNSRPKLLRLSSKSTNFASDVTFAPIYHKDNTNI